MQKSISYVLFADIKGYSRLEQPGLLRFHEIVMPALATRLEDHGWDYCNTWGDAIVFGGKDARNIANMALEMRDFFANYDWAARELPPLDVRISVHVGEHYVGEDPFTNGGLIVGTSVITAARVEPITLPGQIWTTEEAAIAIRNLSGASDRFGLDRIGEITLPKGYGTIKASSLRRSNDAPLADDVKARILAESERRQTDTKAVSENQSKNQYSVVIGIVVHDGNIVLVRRAKNDENLVWMFPSGTLLPLQQAEHAVWREVKEETGLSCRVVADLGSRTHPVTNVHCQYFQMEPTDGLELQNGDSVENDDVRWVKASDVANFIGKDIFPPIAKLLSEI